MGIRHYSKRLGRVLVVTVLMAVVACSSRFVYDRAGWLINWYVDDYVSFDQYQQHVFDQLVASQMAWHRRQELPRYQELLTQLITELEQHRRIDEHRVQYYFERGYGFWHDFMDRAVPGLANVLRTLGAEQVDEIRHGLSREQQRLEGAYAEQQPADGVKERVKTLEDTIEPWFGGLQEAQTLRIRAWAEAVPDVYGQSLRQRARWQQALYQALAQRQDEALLRHRLYVLFVTPESLWPEQYRQDLEHGRRLTYQLLADLYNGASQSQREHILKVGRKYLKDIEKLQKS